jgi:hypothetical protein
MFRTSTQQLQRIKQSPYQLSRCCYSEKKGSHAPVARAKRVQQGPNQLWVATDELESISNAKSLTSNLNSNKIIEALQQLPSRCVSALLPHDYPHSVQPGYLKYVIGQMTGSVTSSAAGVLSMQVRHHNQLNLYSFFPKPKHLLNTCLILAFSDSNQALLHAVGLGSGAIPMAAALNWIIKDGLGQLGGGRAQREKDFTNQCLTCVCFFIWWCLYGGVGGHVFLVCFFFFFFQYTSQ